MLAPPRQSPTRLSISAAARTERRSAGPLTLSLPRHGAVSIVRVTPTDALAPRRPRGRPLVITLVVAAVVIVALVLALLLARALGFFVGGSENRIRIDDGHLSIELAVREGLGVDAIRTDTGGEDAAACPRLFYALQDELTIEAVSAQCSADLLGGDPLMNGDHGTYRSIDDVADPIDPARMSTPIGEAEVFEQQYSEHTNFSRDWTEPVAIVTLAAPADDEFSSLVIRSDKGSLSRAELVEVLESLRALE